MTIKNEPKIKNPLIVAIREQLEHRALWMYLLVDEARKKGLEPSEYAPNAIKRCGLYQGSNLREKAKNLGGYVVSFDIADNVSEIILKDNPEIL